MSTAKKFELLEHQGDEKFLAFGNSLNELFENSGYALADIMFAREKVEAKEKSTEIVVIAPDLEMLLVDFLQELILLVDIEEFLFNRLEIDVKKDMEAWHLRGFAYGEKINLEKHELRTEVKAVTYNDIEVKEENGKWRAQVVIDI